MTQTLLLWRKQLWIENIKNKSPEIKTNHAQLLIPETFQLRKSLTRIIQESLAGTSTSPEKPATSLDLPPKKSDFARKSQSGAFWGSLSVNLFPQNFN